jgi:replicative DNA helicase
MANETKLPPQAIDLEKAVLGAMLIDGRCIDEILDFLRPEAFYKDEHRYIFEAILTLFHENKPIDLLTVSNQLKKNQKLDLTGGDYYLIQLTQKVASSAHIEFHARIVTQCFIKREIIKNSSNLIEKSYNEDTDVFDLLDESFSHLNDVSETIVSNKDFSMYESIKAVTERAAKIYSGEIKPGVETPIVRLTKTMGGWRNGELIIIAARPGMGKTSFALRSAWLASKSGIPTAFFTLEMTTTGVVARCLSMETKIPAEKFIKSGVNQHDQKLIYDNIAQLSNTELYIYDDSVLNINSLRIKTKKLVKEKGLKMIVLDYLQLMVPVKKGKGNREQDVSEISRGLKSLAIELDIPIIALSQLSRDVEKRGGIKRPMLSDLRESGAIEQDADVVMFLYRPAYYNIRNWDDYGQVSTHNEAEYIVSKNRNGGLLRNRMRFEPEYTLFSDLDYDMPAAIQWQNQEIDNEDIPY